MSHPALTRALAACARNLFARPRISSDGAVESFSFGPPGALLLDNVLREWQLSCVLDAPNEMFPFSGAECDLSQALADARTLNPLPLGVAHSWVETGNGATRLADAHVGGEKCALGPARRTVLCASVLVPANLAERTFHGWQRHRNIWWRKLSADPGRYEPSPLSEPDGVGIRAAFPWGAETVETVTLREADRGVGRSEANLRVVRCETSLELAAMALLCDAMDDARTTRLHRKLAPYKIGVLTTADDAALTQLARFLCRQLREAGTSCLLAPPSLTQPPAEPLHEEVVEPLHEESKEPLREKTVPAREHVVEGLNVHVTERLRLHDVLGVPFTLMLGPESLRTGLASLRSRDSTLQEQIHVTDLKMYVELLLKNY